MEGPQQLIDSKKGTVFTTVATAVTTLVTIGGAASMPAAYLISGLAAVYIIGQSLVDYATASKGKNDAGKDPSTGL